MQVNPKPIGLIQDIFHSELLHFLFEIITRIYPDRSIILYNNTDRYNNVPLLQRRYNNYTIRDLPHFFHDLETRVCEKIFLLSYDNLFHIFFTKPYLDNLVFIAHSKKHINAFDTIGANYFALTPLLSKRYLIPFVNTVDTFVETSQNPLFDLDTLRKRSIDESLETIVSVGYFLENNKDLTFIRKLLQTKRVLLLIYAPELTPPINDLISEFTDYVYAGIGLFTSQIRHHIQVLNVKTSLITPPASSKLFTESWSGAFAFSFDNALHPIMPKQLADLYNLDNGSAITYSSEYAIENVLQRIKDLQTNISEKQQSMQDIRDHAFARNRLVLHTILNTSSSHSNFTITDSGVLFNDQHSFTDYTELANSCLLHAELNNTVVIDTDAQLGTLGLALFCICPKITLYNFTQDTRHIDLQRQSFLYQNTINNVRVYNNHIGDTCKRNFTREDVCLNMLTVDRFNFTQRVSIIKVKYIYQDTIVRGSLETISRDHPIIIFTDITDISNFTDIHILVNMGYWGRPETTSSGNVIVYQYGKKVQEDTTTHTVNQPIVV